MEACGQRNVDVRARPILVIAGVCAITAAIFLQFDHRISHYFQNSSHSQFFPLARMVTELGHGVTVLLVFLIILVFYEEYQTALAGIVTIIASGIVVEVLKALFERPRPSGDGLSFPSGHAVTAFAAAVVLAGRFPRFKYIFYGAAIGVALSRVVLKKHFPSDVLAGTAIGLALGCLSIIICMKLKNLNEQRWMRWAGAILLSILSVYAVLGSDTPGYLIAGIGPAVIFILGRRTAVIYLNSKMI